ncbi:MAG: haloacid dehalogenase type II [Alphaproteobacteria bacterium]
MKLSDFKALTFDCYGTLIDWESGILAELRPWAKRNGIGASGDQLLEAYAKLEHEQETATPDMNYREVLRTVHEGLARHFGVGVDSNAALAFGDSIRNWPPFPDSREALTYLKRHYKLVILSNVDRASFAHSNEKLGRVFDAVVTAEDVGSYKPDRRNFEQLVRTVEGLDVPKARILHTAQSVFHDIVPGRAFGLATCWINRRHDKPGAGATPPPDPGAKPDFVFNSMAALAAAHRGEVAG